MIKEFKLYPKQFDFFESKATYSAFIAGVGSGKTTAGALKSFQNALPGTLGMIIAPTFRMMNDSTLKTCQEIIGEENLPLNKTSMEAKLRNGATILFRSAEDPESLRGPNLDWAWIDEGALTAVDTFLITIGRLRAHQQSGKLWVTTTPKGKANWIGQKLSSFEVFRASTLDNPHTSSEWKDMILKEYTGNFKAQEIYGEFVSFEGLVYPMFDRALHIRKPDLDLYEGFGLVVDEGFTNPAVVLKVYYNSFGAYHIREEFYESGRLQSDIIGIVREMMEDHDVEVGVDAAAAGLIADLRSKGIRAKPYKGKVMDGIRKVQNALSGHYSGVPKLTVHPSCVHTIAEFESYVFQDQKDEPVKEFDHAMDSIRYFIDKYRPTLKATQVRY